MEVFAKHRFEQSFRHLLRLGDFQKLEDLELALQVGGLFDELALRRELQNARLVPAGGETQERP